VRVVALAPDLFFASKIDALMRASGHEARIESSADGVAAAVGEVEVVIVDLHAEGLDLPDLVQRVQGRPLLGFYSHVDVDIKERAEQAGFAIVVPRSRAARELPELVATLARQRSGA
jgi:hypothetical protein